MLYNADCNLEPQVANPPWCTTECATLVSDFGTIIGDPGDLVLRIGDDSPDFRAYYCRNDVFDPDCQGTQEAVFEIAGKGIFADTDVHQLDIFLWAALREGNPADPLLVGKDIKIAIATTGVGFTHNPGGGQTWIPDGAYTPDPWSWDEYHIFRVEKHVISDTETEVRLFVDNAAIPQVTLEYNDLESSTANRAAVWTSTPGKSSFYLVFFRYRFGSTTLRTGPNCAADIDNDGTVGVKDLLILLGDWGPCANCNDCPADIDNTCDSDCVVGTVDLLLLLGAWGDCP